MAYEVKEVRKPNTTGIPLISLSPFKLPASCPIHASSCNIGL